MRGSRVRFVLAMVAGLICSSVAASQSAVDLDGNAVNPLAAAGGKVVVLVFVRRDCPVSSRYAPTIQKISKQYRDRVSFWLIDPDKTDSAPEIRKYLDEYGYEMPVLRDPAHALAKISRVQITPEVAVFDHERKLVYDGRIDDWFIEPGKARSAPTTHELKDAIAAALTGKAVAQRQIRGVGCYLSDLE